ncbi:hypothetical protein ACIA8R_49265 [Nonomuraea sp. NPDC051191]|uniref:hypothetical protein n=1 Tax=Nonomuraea sp. NPDC051191 TaxID=3364372 RepID=UPI0037978A30
MKRSRKLVQPLVAATSALVAGPIMPGAAASAVANATVGGTVVAGDGPAVNGPYGWTDAWDVVYRSEGRVGVASDAWIHTGDDIRDQLPQC